MTGHSLASLKLTEEGILVLGIIGRDESYNGVPRGKYIVKPHDRLVVYGKSNHIVSLSNRTDKLQGREEHRKMKERLERESGKDA